MRFRPSATEPRNRQGHPQVISALPTPFDDGGNIDVTTYRRLLRHIQPWVDGVLVSGTTAEFLTLSDAERGTLADEALAVFGPGRTIVHIGAPSLRQVIDLARSAHTSGARRFASLTPFYFPYSTSDVIEFFCELRRQLPEADLFGYFFAERTGVTLAPDEIVDIATAAALDGIKISGDIWHDVPAIRSGVGNSLPIYTGYDTDPLLTQRLGATGVISGLSCIEPRLFGTLSAASEEYGDQLTEQIRRLGQRAGGSIGELKEALATVIPGGWSLRIPASGKNSAELP